MAKRNRIILIIALVVIIVMCCVNAVAQAITIDHPQYYSIYNCGLRCPAQVGWTVQPADLGSARRLAGWHFVSDVPDLLAYVRHSDFTNSGYQRGHLCPAADRSACSELMRGTFRLSNVAPQVPSLNTGAWKASENFCRAAALKYGSVDVVVVPIFLRRDTTFIGANKLAVPHAFFKAAWVTASDSVIGSWFLFNK